MVARSARTSGGGAERPALSPARVFVLLFLAAALLYGFTRQDHLFSDGPALIRMAADSPSPYYHLAYIPLGWSLQQVLGVEARTALELVSALGGALGIGFIGLALLHLGMRAHLALAWGLFAAFTPAIWFFSTTVEFHGLQLGGVALATYLLVRARDSRGWALHLAVAGALLAMFTTHISSALAFPGLLLLALRPRNSRGLQWWHVPLVALYSAALILLVAWLDTFLGDPGLREEINISTVLGRFRSGYVEQIKNRGFFPPGEVLEYLTAEFLRPAALLLPLALLALPLCLRQRRPLFWASLATLIPYLLIVPHGGVRESGAYFLTLYPLLVLVAAEASRWLALRDPSSSRAALAAVLLLALVQGVLGYRTRAFHNRGMAELAWAKRVRTEAPEGSVVLTYPLARYHALPPHGLVPRALALTLDVQPRDRWESQIAMIGQDLAAHYRRGHRVFLDALVVDAPELPDYVQEFTRTMRALLERGDIQGRLQPRGKFGPDPLLYEVILPDAPPR